MFADTLGMKLRGAYLTFHRRAGAHFESLDLTADQFVVLSILADEPGLTQREVVERAFSDPNTIGAILQRLETRRLIRRANDPNDRRVRRVELTPAGAKLQRQLLDGSRSIRQRLSELFTTAEEQALMELLARVPPAFQPLRDDQAARRRSGRADSSRRPADAREPRPKRRSTRNRSG